MMTLALWANGCAPRAKVNATTSPTFDSASTAPGAMAPSTLDEPAIETVVRTLTDLGFEIDQLDRRQGLVTTKPQTVPAWRETAAWSPVSAGTLAQGLTSGLRRVVQVKLPGDGSAARDVALWDIRVRSFRRHDARMQITHTARRNRMNRMDATPTELTGSQRGSWLDQGRDEDAESDLRRRLEWAVSAMETSGVAANQRPGAEALR